MPPTGAEGRTAQKQRVETAFPTVRRRRSSIRLDECFVPLHRVGISWILWCNGWMSLVVPGYGED